MPAPTDSVEIPSIPASVVTPAGTDIHAVSQGGVTKQETNAQIATYLQTLTWPVASGGTGLTSYAIGDILYASGATTLAKLADVATGNALISGGIGAAPSWGKVSLTAAISGVLPVANGGTNLSVYTIGDILYADGATSLAKLADIATGNVLISGGVTTAPSWGKVGLTTHVSGVLPVANGGTGVNNAGTLTNASNTTITGGGTIALGGFTATIPATDTVAMLGVANAFTAVQTAKVTDAATVTSTRVLIANHASSGTPAGSFGTEIALLGSSATVADRDMGVIRASWASATDATRKSRLTLFVADNTTTREGMRCEVVGSAAALGFLGASAVIRQTGGQDLTNNVTSGGVDGTIADFSDLTVFANSAAAIRNDIYQLARSEKQVRDAMRLYGLLT